jgi:hypothetical protein
VPDHVTTQHFWRSTKTSFTFQLRFIKHLYVERISRVFNQAKFSSGGTIVANEVWHVRFIFVPPTNERTCSSVFDILVVHFLNTCNTKLGVQVPRGVSEASKAVRSNPYIKNVSPKIPQNYFVQFFKEMCRLFKMSNFSHFSLQPQVHYRVASTEA